MHLLSIKRDPISLKEFRVGDTIFRYPDITGPFAWISVKISGWGGGPYRFSHCGKIIHVNPIIVAEAKFPAGIQQTIIGDFLAGGALFELMRYREPGGYDPALGLVWMRQVLQNAEDREYDAGQIFANLLNCPWFDHPKRPVCSTFIRDFDQAAGRTLCPDIPRWKIKPNNLAADKQLMFV
jgi:hypothetical protein